MTVVPNAADGAPLAAAAPGARARSIVYMGAFIGYKDVATLVRAAAQLPGWTLHLASRIQPADRTRLEQVAAEAGGASLVFHDGVDDAAYGRLLDEATALVSASRDEGFGLPVVEAMQRGRAGGAHRHPDLPRGRRRRRALRDGGRRRPRSPPRCAGSRTRGSGPAARPRRLQQAARYSWDASAARLLPVLERVAAAHR